jgi:hypothetical protein
LEAFTAVRNSWLSANGYGSGEKHLARDRLLRQLVHRDSLWLWFEDDLYDQLQLLQLLHFIDAEGLTTSPHFLVDIPRSLTLEQMAAFAAGKTRLTPAMIATGVRAWKAFTSDAVPALLETDLSALPHLRPAMERLLEHRPGNFRVERTILALLAAGGRSKEQLFADYQATEDRPFLGDTTFFRYLDGLSPRVERDSAGIYHLVG